jgi:hypothetical protein
MQNDTEFLASALFFVYITALIIGQRLFDAVDGFGCWFPLRYEWVG